MLYCVKNWIFLSENLVVYLEEAMKRYTAACQALPAVSALQSICEHLRNTLSRAAN